MVADRFHLGNLGLSISLNCCKENIMRSISVIILCFIISLCPLLAQEQPQNKEYRELFSMFKALELPDVKGKKFVFYNTGKYEKSHDFDHHEDRLVFTYVVGWVFSESKEEIEIFSNNFARHMYKRDYSLPAKWDKYKHHHNKSTPLPGNYKELNFAKFCKGFMRGTVSKNPDIRKHFVGNYLDYEAQAALFAHWAMKLAMTNLAFKLVDDAKEAFSASHQGVHKELVNYITYALATNARWQAINDANNGFPRTELLERWEIISKFPENEYTKEAKSMVSAYKNLIAEDKKWVEPTKQEFEKKTFAEKASYWLYWLRDLDPTQMMQPGGCPILVTRIRCKDMPNPACKLDEMGWEALPYLIKHIDDMRPTRCLEYCRDFEPDSFELLRYSDCCQYLFRMIAGIEIFDEMESDDYMNPAEEAKEAKKNAQQWWNKAKDKGPESHYLELLKTKESLWGPHFAAEKLVKINSEKYLPFIIEVASKSNENEQKWIFDTVAPYLTSEYKDYICNFLYMDYVCLATETLLRIDRDKYLPELVEFVKNKKGRYYGILSVIAPQLGEEYKDFLIACLESDNLHIVCISAETLWRKWKVEKGVRKLIQHVEQFTEEQEKKVSFFTLNVIYFLPAVQKDFVVDAICKFTSHELWWEVKHPAVKIAFEFPYKRMLNSLLPLLQDKNIHMHPGGQSYKFRFCDMAAESICKMIGYHKEFYEEFPVEERDKFIKELKDWLEKNKDSLDWKELRRKAEERRKEERRRIEEARKKSQD